MKKISSRQPAQIGVVAVLLTTVLLAIGVSVTAQVSQQVAQETSRSESQQALNQAESAVDIAAGSSATAPSSDLTGDVTGSIGSDAIGVGLTPTGATPGDTIYLQAGESVEINCADNPNGCNSSNTISWEFGPGDSNHNSAPALYISFYSDSNVEYFPYTGKNTGTSGNRTGYASAGDSAIAGFANQITLGSPSFGSPKIVRIKALYGNTYISMPGLTTVARAAASNVAGDETRVMEQYQTAPGVPYVLDFALFAGGGSITQ